MDSVYLYTIVDTPGEGEEATGLAGLDGVSPVRVVAHGGVGCVVSSYGGRDLGTASKETVLRSLLRHQQVVEQVMPGRAVLPVKFGTMLQSVGEVVALLAQARQELSRTLESVRGKVEVEVAATWEVARILEAVSREEAVAGAREAMAAKGNPTVEDRVRLGQVVKACMDRRRDAYRGRMLAVLQPLSFAVAPNALVSEELVMNVAFLIDEARQPEFDRGVKELDEAFQEEITFRVIGPLPPYSFSTVEIDRLRPSDIELARSTLGLSHRAAASEVRKAYRRLAAQEQRDGAPSAKLSGERLAKLRQASAVLLASLRAGGAGDRDPLFAVTIKGSEHREIEAARFGAAIKV